MRKLSLALFAAVLMLSLAGCGAGTRTDTEQAVNNPITGKLYMLNTQSTFDFQFMMFYDDGTFQGIYTRSKNHKSYSGTYAIDGNGLTLNYSDMTLAGAILDGGACVQFGDAKFIDWTEQTSEDDPLYFEFR